MDVTPTHSYSLMTHVEILALGFGSISPLKFTWSKAFSNRGLTELCSTKGGFLLFIQNSGPCADNLKFGVKIWVKISGGYEFGQNTHDSNYHLELSRLGADDGRKYSLAFVGFSDR